MLIQIIVFVSYLLQLHSFELCNQNDNFYCKKLTDNVTETCRTELSNVSENCRLSDFTGSDNVKLNFGNVLLHAEPEASQNYISVSVLPIVPWNRALVKFAEYNNPKTCQIFTVDKNENVIDILKYECYWNEKQKFKEAFVLEINAESDSQLAHKKILFSIPDTTFFSNAIPASKRHIFSYIDFTYVNKIILKIQPLPEIYELTHYKVEVFREKEQKSILLDVRLIRAQQTSSIDFEYITYSEEGYYYFAISVIGKNCPEDFCFKTLTPKVHIARRGRPLVIGIVGASFLIPLVLFSLYLWNQKYKNQGGYIIDPIKKVMVLFKPSFEKHNDVVSTIIDSIESFSNPEVLVDRINLSKVKEKTVEKFCSDNLILATHVVYINPPYTDDDFPGLDYMTFNFLKEETKKKTSDRTLIVIRLPYSKKDVPSILSRATHFDLVQDFSEFINSFSNIKIQSDYCLNPLYMDLAKKIELASLEADMLNNVPEIVVTDECEEPNEIDGLI